MIKVTPQSEQKVLVTFENPFPNGRPLTERANEIMQGAPTTSSVTSKPAMFKAIAMGSCRTILGGALLVVLIPLLLVVTFLLLIIAVPVVLPVMVAIEAKKKLIG